MKKMIATALLAVIADTAFAGEGRPRQWFPDG
jgi:hypothetical protein